MIKLIRIIEDNVENFKIIVAESNGLSQICKKYKIADNGKNGKILKEYIVKHNLNISHFGLTTYKQKYELIEKECPVCKNKFVTQKNHKREKITCSHKCGNNYFKRSHSEESKENIRNGLRRYYTSIGKVLITNECNIKKRKLAFNPENRIFCKFCKLEVIKPYKKLQQYCSPKCRMQCPEFRKKLSDSAKLRVSNGTHKGWLSRTIISYPEKFFMEVLKNNNILYKHNKKVGKYFIDFAIMDKMIALEIDGSQHKLEERKLNDIEKDKFLNETGWKVYRISWNGINNENGKLLMKEKIDEFLEFCSTINILIAQ
jgi:very-short-patch-repair endonuclease